jgi:hypothetical protein
MSVLISVMGALFYVYFLNLNLNTYLLFGILQFKQTPQMV